jgi:membrane associated rhomboid family serine protease
MIARWLARKFREFPATSVFCLVWVLVFVAMTYHHVAGGSPLSATRWLLLGFGGGESFGDLTLDDLSRGQIWRLITCNFIHYSLVHLGLNLLAMYQLGGLLESWYGPYQLILIYGLTGGGGNLLSALARLWMRSNREVHSAGGSVAIMGMVGVCAVAGWRSGSPDGRRLSRMMLIFIALTAALGAAFPRFIDNWGHAGGLIVGLALGLAHRGLCARVGKPSAWGAGVLTGLVIAGSAAIQYVSDRREAPARLERSLVRRSEFLGRATKELAWLQRANPPHDHLVAAARWLDVLDQILDGPARAEADALRPLLAAAQQRPLDQDERREFDERVPGFLRLLRQKYEDDRHQLRRLRDPR